MKPYFSFQWHITDACDQRCKHCYIYSAGDHTCLLSMDWKQMEDTFYNCLDHCKVYDRTPYFYITGGDPILHPDFWRLLELIHEHDIKFTILGNPFHLNDQVCRELKWYGCEKYQLSLDGLRETHDWFRKPGSFDCTLEKIGCINRAGIRSVIMTTVSKTNRMEVPGIIDEAVKAGANVFAFSRYVPSGGAAKEESHSDSSIRNFQTISGLSAVGAPENENSVQPPERRNCVDASMTAQEYRELLAICDKKFRESKAFQDQAE